MAVKNVSRGWYNSGMMTTNGTKYTFVCDPDECDTLIEVTCVSGFDFPNGVIKHTCPCGRQMSYLSATILSSQLTKEEQMETTVSPAVNYNPDLLVTYKVINGNSDPEYATDKVRNIEWDLHNYRTNSKTVSSLQNKISLVKDIITEAYSDSDDQETLRLIAEALEIELIKEVEFTASIEVSGTYSFNILDNDYDLDLDSVIADALFADSNDGNIEVNDTEVCNVRES
jgi:hypothetical protein